MAYGIEDKSRILGIGIDEHHMLIATETLKFQNGRKIPQLGLYFGRGPTYEHHECIRGIYVDPER